MPIATRETLMLVEDYLATLNEAQLDRVLMAQNWCRRVPINIVGDRCLVGHAADYKGVGLPAADPSAIESVRYLFNHPSTNPALAFDRTSCNNMEAAVSYIKARAAEIAERKFPLRVPAPMPKAEPQMEEVGA